MKLWMPGAAKVHGPHSFGGDMVGGDALCTHHITVSPVNSFASTRDFLVREGFEPTLLLDPTGNKRAQFLPANRSAYALEHPRGCPETNREGSIHVQIEWLWPSMAKDITKAPHFAEIWADLIPWLEQLGVPSVWTFGNPLATSRSEKAWKKAGHRGHRNAPHNSHVDSLPCKTEPAWHAAPVKPPAKKAAAKPKGKPVKVVKQHSKALAALLGGIGTWIGVALADGTVTDAEWKSLAAVLAPAILAYFAPKNTAR